MNAFLVQFWQRRFGRSSRAALDIARLCVALSGIAPCLFMPPASLPLSCFAFALMAVWGGLIASLPLISWERNIKMSEFVMTIDFVIIGLIIAFSGELVLVTLPYAILLFVTLQGALHRALQLTIVIAVIILLTIFGIGSVAERILFTGDMPQTIVRLAFALISLLAVATIRARASYGRRLRLWSEGLLVAGTHSQRVPIDFILDELDFIYPDRKKYWLVDEKANTPSIAAWDGERMVPVTVPERAWEKARALLSQERVFMFDPTQRTIVHHAEIERPTVSACDPLFDLIETLRLGGGVIAIPVRTTDISARLFIEDDEKPTIAALREGILVGQAIEAVFERFTFQNAWRDRAYAEARMALGRDLHDSVLQTMASLRMQVAALTSGRSHIKDTQLREAIEGLQKTVAQEQRNFREVLDESRRAESEPLDLNAILADRAEALGAQWNVDCGFTPTAEPLLVDGNAAVEVEFIIREVVSNAVQHGGAKALGIRLSVADDMLLLSIVDQQAQARKNAMSDGQIKSKSLARRLTYLGATAYADETYGGSLLSIRIPFARI